MAWVGTLEGMRRDTCACQAPLDSKESFQPCEHSYTVDFGPALDGLKMHLVLLPKNAQTYTVNCGSFLAKSADRGPIDHILKLKLTCCRMGLSFCGACWYPLFKLLLTENSSRFLNFLNSLCHMESHKPNTHIRIRLQKKTLQTHPNNLSGHTMGVWRVLEVRIRASIHRCWEAENHPKLGT